MALQASLFQWFQSQHQTLLLQPLSLSLFFFSLCFLLWFSRTSGRKPLNLPPSPPRLPVIGHLHCLGSLPHRSLQLLSRDYGPLMLLHLGQTPTLVVSSAKMAEQIFKTHDVAFADRPVTTASKTFLYGGKDLVGAQYGEHWRQVRKLCVTDLLSVKRVRSFKFVREEEISVMVEKIKQSSLRGEKVNLSVLIGATSTNIVSRIAIGRRLEGEWGNTKHAELSKKTMELFGSPSVEDMFPSLGWIDVLTGLDRKMKNTAKAILQFYDEVIEEHLVARKKGSGGDGAKDFMDLLLDAEGDSSLGVPFDRENLKALIMNVFVAGTDTTTLTLQWAMAELLSHADVLKRVQDEVRKIVGFGSKSKIDENDIHKMQYLNCVIKETLRLHPPIVFVIRRESGASGINIESYDIPSKATIMINVWAIARDPKVWDKPNEFIPERFINNGIDFRGCDFEFLPFGAGRRVCPGISFGTTSIEIILASILYWFDWKLPIGEDVDITESFGLTVPMKSPLRLVPISHIF